MKNSIFFSSKNCLSNKPGTFIFENNEKDEIFKYPYNELLLWAVLMKRQKLAMFMCKRGEETLAKAIVAAKLNKALAKEAELDELDSEISDEFKKYSDEFANLALGLLDKCYKEDDEVTSQLLTYDLVNWSHWTCLSLAVSANLKDFLSHASCQLLISDLWMGGMKIRKHITYKVITALLCPPAIFAIQFKSAEELQYMPQTQEEYEYELENQDSDDDNSSSSSSISGNNGSMNHRDSQEHHHHHHVLKRKRSKSKEADREVAEIFGEHNFSDIEDMAKNMVFYF
jgi:transient receptor potential cation channel subfamily M protein 3